MHGTATKRSLYMEQPPNQVYTWNSHQMKFIHGTATKQSLYMEQPPNEVSLVPLIYLTLNSPSHIPHLYKCFYVIILIVPHEIVNLCKIN